MSDPQWLKFAESHIGLREVKGPKHSSKIVEFWRRLRIGVADDETPWCAAFVGAMLDMAGHPTTRSGWAMSYAKYGWPVPYPARGSIAYMHRKNKAGKVIGGHVGFVVGERADGSIMILGGNQGDAVSVAPFSKARIMGYRWPTQSIPQRAPLPIYSKDNAPLSWNEA